MKKKNLAFLPTPLVKLKFNGNSFLMKRDDLTGAELSGNKVRKLEYLLAQAGKEKAEYIFTCGGSQSNHCRATAIAASQLEFKTKLFLWGSKSEKTDGNLFLSRIAGSEIKFLNADQYNSVNDIMFDERKKYKRKRKKVFVIPEGGSTTTGILGYVDFMKELSGQISLKNKKGIFAAAGTGGTAAGLLVGASLLRLDIKIYAVSVLYSAAELAKKIFYLAQGCIFEHNLKCSLNMDNLIIVDGYSSEGYKNISDDKLKLITKFVREAGILLDPAYTGKAFCAFNDIVLKKNNGNKFIFLHTGGFNGIWSKRLKYLANM